MIFLSSFKKSIIKTPQHTYAGQSRKEEKLQSFNSIQFISELKLKKHFICPQGAICKAHRVVL